MLLNHRYELQEVLGRGGFATTYRALDTQTNQYCAIKCLSFRKLGEWKAYELFEREANILNTLHHPQIPKHLDFFSVESGGDVQFYLVQEYVDGKSLAQKLAEGAQFTEREVAEIGLEVLNILNYLHGFAPPIIHRDIKPSNIIVTPEGRVVLIDFGAVREKICADYSTIGGGSTIVGTYGYMPFEQFEGRAVPASDIYSLGMTLITLLSRKEPGEIEKKGEKFAVRAHADISSSFATLLDKMTDRDLKKRYLTAQQATAEIQRVLSGKRLYRHSSVVFSRLAMLLIALVLLLAFAIPKFLSKAPIPSEEPPSPTIEETEQTAPPQDVSTLTSEKWLQTSRALYFSKEDEFGALLAAIKAFKSVRQEKRSLALKYKLVLNLQEILSGVHLKNMLNAHAGTAFCVAFSPNGELFASGGMDDQAVKIWNVKTGQEVFTLTGHPQSIWGVVFHPDGKRLISASSDGTIAVWNVADGTKVLTFPKQQDVRELLTIDISPDGTMLAIGGSNEDGTLSVVKLLNFSDGQELHRFQDAPEIIRKIRFSPNGSLLAASGSGFHQNTLAGALSLWKIHEKEKLTTFYGNARSISDIDFSPDSANIIGGSNDAVEMWSVQAQQKIFTFPEGTADPVVFAPDGKSVFTTRHGMITSWNVATGKATATISGVFAFYDLACSSDGRLIISGQDKGKIGIWQTQNQGTRYALFGHTDNVNSVAFNPDGTLLASAGRDATIRLWSGTDFRLLDILSRHKKEIRTIDFSHDGRLLASGSDDMTIKLWDIENRTEIASLTGHHGALHNVVFSPTRSEFASSGLDGNIFLWDVSTKQILRTLNRYGIHAINYRQDGNVIAAIDGGEIIVWNLLDHTERAITHAIDGYFHSTGGYFFSNFSFSPDGKILPIPRQNWSLSLWNIEEPRELYRLPGHENWVHSVIFHPGDPVVITGSQDKKITFWNSLTGEDLATTDIGCPVSSLALRSDGEMLAVGCRVDKKTDTEAVVKILSLQPEELLRSSCQWLEEYLHTNPALPSEDRTICDDILTQQFKWAQ